MMNFNNNFTNSSGDDFLTRLKPESDSGEPNKPFNSDEVVSFGKWFGFILLAIFPITALPVLIVYSIIDTNKNLKNWARAVLLLYIIGFIIFRFITLLGLFSNEDRVYNTQMVFQVVSNIL
ncbi:hypothetical protein HLPCO_002274 [Haloplasma contractile SSD-17B]|uniref:Uncharacterized protein n=2 Tax=Haloplasma TaxID=471824 RepID=U2EAC6_9MOLU|nr:hypothetical protein HLPCO_002274 [Haloplasma contractile SSD-17B]